nr:hypothetical protein [Tanacetum cinerariifolium]
MSFAATVNSSIHSTRALVPSRTDLLLPRKRFRDSISLEDNVEKDIDTNVLEDIEVDATTVEVAVDRDVEAGIDIGIVMKVDVGIDVEDEVEDEVESSDRGTIEVGVDMDAGIDIPDGMLMPDAVEHLEQRTLRLLRDSWRLVASRERAGLSDRTRSSERENIKVQALLSIKRDRVDSLRRHMTLSQEEFRQVRKDRDDTRRRLRRHVIEIPLQRVEDIETGQKELETRSLIACGERASLVEQVTSLERSNARLRGTVMMESARANKFRKLLFKVIIEKDRDF